MGTSFSLQGMCCPVIVKFKVETEALVSITIWQGFPLLLIFLNCLFNFGCAEPLLWHAVFLCCSAWGLVAPRHVGSYFPNQGLNLHPLHWKLDS